MGQPKILLVEDSEDDVFFFKRTCKRAGIDPVLEVAGDGAKAIAKLEQSGAPKPDLIFLDLKMPNQNGFEVLEWLRKNPSLKNTKVFVLTSSAEPKERELAKQLGADEYFIKPLPPEQLRAILDDLAKNSGHT